VYFHLFDAKPNTVTDVLNLLVESYGISPDNSITLFNEQAGEENVIDELDNLTNLP
jgi:hypothetical protein